VGPSPPIADDCVGRSGHAGVGGVLSQGQAELAVDGVAEVVGDAITQKGTDVPEDYVSRRVAAACFDVFLAGAFGDRDHTVGAPFQAGLQCAQEAVGAIEVERRFWHEADICVRVGKGGVGGDEAGVSAHEFHDPYAVERSSGFVVGHRDGFRGLVDGCGEAKAPLDPEQVVVDGLWDADHGQRNPSGASLCPAARSIVTPPVVTPGGTHP